MLGFLFGLGQSFVILENLGCIPQFPHFMDAVCNQIQIVAYCLSICKSIDQCLNKVLFPGKQEQFSLVYFVFCKKKKKKKEQKKSFQIPHFPPNNDIS